MLSNEKYTEEEASSSHEGEFLSLDSLERSDNNDEGNDGTGAEENNCYGDGEDGSDGVDDRNTGARGGSAEWLGSLGPSALTEAFSDMAKAKASSSTKLIKRRSW